MCLQIIKSVALPNPEIIGVPKKFGQSLDIPTYSSLFSNVLAGFSSDAFYECPCQIKAALPVPELIGGTQKLERSLTIPTKGEAPWGSGMVPFDRRALVSSYRPSIVTFPLSLLVSEISSLSLPHLYSLPKIYPCSPVSRWVIFGLPRAKVRVELIVCAISFQDSQPAT